MIWVLNLERKRDAADFPDGAYSSQHCTFTEILWI